MFEDRVFKEVMKWKWGHEVPWASNGFQWAPILLTLEIRIQTRADQETTRGQREKTATYKLMRGAAEDTYPLTPWPWSSRSRTVRKQVSAGHAAGPWPCVPAAPAQQHRVRRCQGTLLGSQARGREVGLQPPSSVSSSVIMILKYQGLFSELIFYIWVHT